MLNPTLGDVATFLFLAFMNMKSTQVADWNREAFATRMRHLIGVIIEENGGKIPTDFNMLLGTRAERIFTSFKAWVRVDENSNAF